MWNQQIEGRAATLKSNPWQGVALALTFVSASTFPAPGLPNPLLSLKIKKLIYDMCCYFLVLLSSTTGLHKTVLTSGSVMTTLFN